MAFVPERRFQLLAVLAMQSGQWVARDRLAALLWPERPRYCRSASQSAPRGVQGARHRGRIAGQRPRPVLGRGDRPARLRVAARCRATALAVALRRGMLLDGLDDAANPAFSEWLAAERLRFDERWRQAALDALAAAAAGDAELARRVRAVDPLDEDALEAQLRAEIEQGHPARAWQLYRDYAHSPAEALGVEPSHRLRDLLQREAPAGPANESRAPATGAVAATPSSPATPEAAAAFVGRRGELAELMRLLAREACAPSPCSAPAASARAASRGARCTPRPCPRRRPRLGRTART
ncbi:MAG: BTAD domain-containing putative transcriptional regulator [Rubrivivax sp.]